MTTVTIDAPPDLSQLVETHHRRLRGWFRARVGARADAEDLAQRTWIEVLKRAHTFDPSRGTFWAFTLIWADFIRRRYWHEGSRAPLASGDASDLEKLRSAPTEPADDAVAASSLPVFNELLRRTLGCRRLTHEILAFGFVKLLGWPPKRFVAELSSASLSELVAHLEREYVREVPDRDVRSAFAELARGLTQRLGDSRVDPRVLAPYDSLRQRTIGELALAELYLTHSSPEECVTRWWAAVGRVVTASIADADDGPLAEWLSDARTFAARAPRPTAQRAEGNLQ